MGPQCLTKDKNVYGFKGYDAEGIPWQTFFDSKTKLPILGISGDGEPETGSTRIEFEVEKYKIVSSFDPHDESFFPLECVKDYNFEGVDQAMMPTADFGLLVL